MDLFFFFFLLQHWKSEHLKAWHSGFHIQFHLVFYFFFSHVLQTYITKWFMFLRWKRHKFCDLLIGRLQDPNATLLCSINVDDAYKDS